jgi:phosphate transport system substrate-binding protein
MKLLLLVSVLFAAFAKGETVLVVEGKGASFPGLVHQDWSAAFSQENPQYLFTYEAVGSSAGKQAIIDGTVAYAGSDSFLTEDEIQANPNLQMIPIVVGAITPAVNIDTQGNDLKLSREAFVGIYDGSITKWNDPLIVATNTYLSNNDADIVLVVRADGSGSTEVMTRALSSMSIDWANNIGISSLPSWPRFDVQASGSSGMVNAVSSTPNSIGYTSHGEAVSAGLVMPAIENKMGEYIAPSFESLGQSLAQINLEDDGTMMFDVTDMPGEGVYPILTASYFVIQKDFSHTDCEVADAVRRYFFWIMTSNVASEIAFSHYFISNSLIHSPIEASFLLDFVANMMTCQGNPTPFQFGTGITNIMSGIDEIWTSFNDFGIYVPSQYPVVYNIVFHETMPGFARFTFFGYWLKCTTDYCALTIKEDSTLFEWKPLPMNDMFEAVEIGMLKDSASKRYLTFEFGKAVFRSKRHASILTFYNAIDYADHLLEQMSQENLNDRKKFAGADHKKFAGADHKKFSFLKINKK